METERLVKVGAQGKLTYCILRYIGLRVGWRGLLRSVGSCLFLLLESKRTFLIQTIIVDNHHTYYCVTINLTDHK